MDEAAAATSLDADVAMEPATEWADYEADGEEWADYEADGEDWEAMDGVEWEEQWEEEWEEEDLCVMCGMPSWFPPWPLCEACSNADDDATTASGDLPEELADDDEWESVFELDDR
jgi:hypothetical protein